MRTKTTSWYLFRPPGRWWSRTLHACLITIPAQRALNQRAILRSEIGSASRSPGRCHYRGIGTTRDPTPCGWPPSCVRMSPKSTSISVGRTEPCPSPGPTRACSADSTPAPTPGQRCSTNNTGQSSAPGRAQMDHRLRQREDPEDVVQSVLRTVIRRAAKGEFHIDGGGQLWRLLATITRRKMLKHVTKIKAKKRSPEKEEQLKPGEISSRDPNPQAATLAADLMEKTLEGLDESHAKVFHLRLQGCSRAQYRQANGLHPPGSDDHARSVAESPGQTPGASGTARRLAGAQEMTISHIAAYPRIPLRCWFFSSQERLNLGL